MTTQLLPTIITSPFGRSFDSERSIFQNGMAETPEQVSKMSTAIFGNDTRQFSCSTVLSVASTPPFTGYENQNPFSHFAAEQPSQSLRSSSAHSPSMRPLRTREPAGSPTPFNECHFIHQKRLLEKFPQASAFSPSESGAVAPKISKPQKHQKRIDDFYTPLRSVWGGQTKSRIAATVMTPAIHETPSSQAVSCTGENPAHHTTSLLRRGSSQYLGGSGDEYLPGDGPQHSHRKRLSTASSGFIHTIKTASFSNTSLSLKPRSARLGQSSDTYGVLNSCTRCSIESDRPITAASLDEFAVRRGLRRRQIIIELVTTEECYVADLKALNYLYSTLLATNTLISPRVRSLVLRNVNDILHIHEELLERLHSASFQAALRKWVDTSSPRQLGSPRKRTYWRSFESAAGIGGGPYHHQTGRSVDSTEMVRARRQLGSADPQDVADIAAIFGDLKNDLLIYEEYCANHSLIAHELQKNAPNLWSSYESGIESLAKSLMALEHKQQSQRRGLTVRDLLIKPIQRITKYPLLFDDLLRQTPVADCPTTHTDLEVTLHDLKEVVRNVNFAVDSHEARLEIQRRWALHSMLNFDKIPSHEDKIRALGKIQVCGLLFIVFQARSKVDGAYALCTIFDSALMVALPTGSSLQWDVIALIRLSDLKTASARDGRGLQCPATLYTWKICFEVKSHLHEIILSACSAAEEQAWMQVLERQTAHADNPGQMEHISSTLGLDLRSLGIVYGQQNQLSRKPSVQRAATVAHRGPICHVIIRNTHNTPDSGGCRQSPSVAINRSQSHMTSNRVAVFAPKRSERARLENSLSEVWTKDKLPFPGLVGSRGGQIIRASAGSLVRKLSLASIPSHFSRRSASLTSRRSFDGPVEGRRCKYKGSLPIFEVRKESLDAEVTPVKKINEVPEVDTMDRVVSRMIGGSRNKRLSFSHTGDSFLSKSTWSKRSTKVDAIEIGPEDPAEVFYQEDKEEELEKVEGLQECLVGKKKRWSNPICKLRGLSTEGLRHMLYSTK